MKPVKKMILINSSYYEILEEFWLPNSTLFCIMNIMFPPIKCKSMKHMWDLIGVGKITMKIVREVITLATVKNIPGPKTYLVKS